MLGRYISINGEILPNPINYSEAFTKVAVTNQSESGKDLVKNLRNRKYTGSFTFDVSSYWKSKLYNYYLQPSINLTVGNNTYTARIEEFHAELVQYSEYSNNTDGYWTVTFDVIEF